MRDETREELVSWGLVIVMCVVLMLASCLLSGCSLIDTASTMFGITTEGPPAMEPAPEPPYDLIAHVQEQTCFVRAVLDRVYADGVEKYNDVVFQASESAGFLLAFSGSPVEVIEVPTLVPEDDTEKAAEVIQAIAEEAQEKREDAASLLAKQREAEAEWKANADAASRKPSKRRFAISSPYIMLFGTGGLVATLGGLALTLRKTLRKVALYKGTLSRVFLGVRAFLGVPPEEVAKGTPQKGLLDSLSRKMHQPDKDVIKDLYKKTAAL